MNKILNQIDDKFPGIRSTERWNCETYAYSSTDEFCKASHFSYGIHTIFGGGLPIDLHLDLKSNLPLVICLNGALSSRDHSLKLPVFSGFGVLSPAEASIVRISDPILYTSTSIKHGWYAGAAGMLLIKDIFNILHKIIHEYKPTKVIFFGGSSGGFASLNISRLFKDSIAVVWNPQTDILKFAKEHVEEYARNAYGLPDFDACEKLLPAIVHTSIYKDYVKGENSNYVLYMQNLNDWHVRWHCKPFLNATGRKIEGELSSQSLGTDFYLYIADWGSGHAPPPKDFQKRLMSYILNTDLSPRDLFSESNLQKILSSSERNPEKPEVETHPKTLTSLREFHDLSGNQIVYKGSHTPTDVKISFDGRRNKLTIDNNAKLQKVIIDFKGNDAEIVIGSCNARCMILIGSKSKIHIGDGLSTTGAVYITAFEGSDIHIGQDCMFAGNVQIRGDDAHPIFDTETGKRVNISESINIGEHVWLGEGCVILTGSDIGSGSIVGTRSVVKAKIPNNSVAAGVPAKVIRSNIAWDRTHLSREEQFNADGTLKNASSTIYWQSSKNN